MSQLHMMAVSLIRPRAWHAQIIPCPLDTKNKEFGMRMIIANLNGVSIRVLFVQHLAQIMQQFVKSKRVT